MAQAYEFPKCTPIQLANGVSEIKKGLKFNSV